MCGQVKYDVVDRMSLGTVGSAVRQRVKYRDASSIHRYLVDAGIARQGQKAAGFNYGRNALFSLFRERFAGKTVIFPGFICPSIVWAAVRAGVRPEFIDVSLDDFNLDVNLLSDEDIDRAGALLVNHTFGVPVNIEAIRGKVKEHPIYLIEDIAPSLFARYKGEYVGRLGDAVLVSLYKQTPNINGAILLSDRAIAEPAEGGLSPADLARLVWLTSGPPGWLVNIIRRRRGIGGEAGEFQRGELLRRPSPLALSLFAVLFPDLKDLVDRKRAIAGHYQKRAGQSKYFIPQQVDATKEPSWFNFSLRLLPEFSHLRDALLIALRRKGIFGDRLWHDSPVTLAAFKEYLKGDYSNAKLLAKSVINLPIEADYRERDVDYLFDCVEETLRRLI